MPADKSRNLQDVYLNHIRKNRTPVTIFLVNKIKLQGVVTWFDNFCVLLRRDAHSQLVYKHAISTVMSSVPVRLFEPDADADADAGGEGSGSGEGGAGAGAPPAGTGTTG